MTHDYQSLRAILTRSRVIAMVGASINPARPSHSVGTYMAANGYRVIPVNPGHAGKQLFGETVRASLADLTEEGLDMLDIFRRSEDVLPVVQEALDLLPGLSTIWMQIGVVNEEAAALARAKGIEVVMNRCPKIDHARLIR